MNREIQLAIAGIKAQRIDHLLYRRAVSELFHVLAAARPGEVVVLVGPSRTGKSEAIKDALEQTAGPQAKPGSGTTAYVIIEAENASTAGSFSTKAFTQAACKAIGHPIYGVVAPDDPEGYRLDQRIHRTPESMLRSAFERATRALKTRYVVIDEAQHVKYVSKQSGGAIACLDSWKCMARKTETVLVLLGTYELLALLCGASHLIGRQMTVEFPRYRADVPDHRKAYKQVLLAWSRLLPFTSDDLSLLVWTKYIHEHTLGCVGHLSIWLRAALASMASNEEPAFSLEALARTRYATSFVETLWEDIARGEHILRSRDRPSIPPSSPAQASTGPKRRPFQRASKRHPLGGRE